MTTKTKRYTVRDVRIGQDTHLTGKVREPWQVIDTKYGRIYDEFHSKRAADGTARDLNKKGNNMTIIEAMQDALEMLEATGYRDGGDVHDYLEAAIRGLKTNFPAAAEAELPEIER